MDKAKSNTVVTSLEGFFKALPPLPANAVTTLFKIAPWIALVFGILGVLSGLAGFGILTVFAPFAVAGGVHGYGLGFISAIGLAVSSLMMLIAFPGLKAGKMNGWNMLFWSEVVSGVASLIGFSIGSVVGALIGFYLLFQIKSRYK